MNPGGHCEMCGDSGVVQVERIEYVTHDMAIDAGAPEMEGQPQPQGFEEVPCPQCSVDDGYLWGPTEEPLP